MKKSIIFLTLVTLCLAACKKGDKNAEYYSVTEPEVASSVAPLWQVDYSGNEARPDWQEPDPTKYENWMIMYIELEDILKPTAAPNDLLAIFVEDELRGMATPAVTVGEETSNDKGIFILKSYHNEPENTFFSFTLRYYSATLHQLFSYESAEYLELGKVYGMGTHSVFPFTQGAASYPLLTHFCVTCLPLEGTDVKPAKGDILAAFVGDECRGTYVFDDDLWFSPVRFNVRARKEGETVTLKYYHAGTGRIFTFVPTAVTSKAEQSLTVRM